LDSRRSPYIKYCNHICLCYSWIYKIIFFEKNFWGIWYWW